MKARDTLEAAMLAPDATLALANAGRWGGDGGPWAAMPRTAPQLHADAAVMPASGQQAGSPAGFWSGPTVADAGAASAPTVSLAASAAGEPDSVAPLAASSAGPALSMRPMPTVAPVNPWQVATAAPSVFAGLEAPGGGAAPQGWQPQTSQSGDFGMDAAVSAAPSSGGFAAPQTGAGGFTSSLPSSAPPAMAGQGGPTGGVVNLDGTRMGSWVAEHLAREAGRPQSASTAFDPLLSPRWPGTLQGS